MPRVASIMLSAAFLLQTMSGAQSAPPQVPIPQAPHHPPLAGDGRPCMSCHTEVTSRPVMHAPAASGACDRCHLMTASNGRATTFTLANGARRGDTRRLCVACHEEVSSKTAGLRAHAPVASGDCTACHNPHGSPLRYFLPSEGNDACLTCHRDVAEELRQPFQHGPAATSCTLCHDAHADTFPYQMRAPVNTVCLGCHLKAGSDDGLPPREALFGKAGAQQTLLITGGPRIPLDATRRAGHPSLRHPVEGPTNPAIAGRALSCASCHNPHGAQHRMLLRFGATGVSSLCVQCHPF